MVAGTDKKPLVDRWLYIYAILFGLSYSQAALFAPNQNTKFISGLALANYRDVASDWMAHITDPFLLFSVLLKWQYHWLGLYFGVHFSFFLIVAIYGMVGVWMAKGLIAHNEERQRTLLIFALLWLFINTIGIRNLLLDFFPAGLARQYVLGTYYQPCCFGVLILAGIAAYASKQAMLAAVCFVIATLFHPAYLVSSAILAAAIIVLPANRSLEIGWGKRLLFLSLVAGVLIPYAVWSVDLLTSADPLIRYKAHYLLSTIRIPHHTVPAEWRVWRTLIFFLVGFVAAWLGRKQLMGQLLFVTLWVVAATILWVVIIPNPTVAVVAPWRISVILAPLSWVILIAGLSPWTAQKIQTQSFISLDRLGKVLIIAVALACLAGILGVFFDYQHKIERNDYPISRFIANYHKPGNQYLVPLDQMDIRLEAGVPVFATWKSHPTKDSEFLEWYKRIETARAIYEKRGDRAKSDMLVLIENHSVTHVVWPISKGDFPFSQMGQQVYRDTYFSLWDMRRASRG